MPDVTRGEWTVLNIEEEARLSRWASVHCALLRLQVDETEGGFLL